MSSDECAELLRATKEQIEEMARGGDLPALKIGRSWLFLRQDLLTFLAEKARREAEERRARRQPGVQSTASNPRRQVPPVLPTALLGNGGTGDVTPTFKPELKFPPSKASDREQVLEVYSHCGMKIEICREAGRAWRPTYFAVVINPNSKTKSGTAVEGSFTYSELRAAAEARAEHTAAAWARKQAKTLGR